MPAASTTSTTGSPRRRPTTSAASRVAERCTSRRAPRGTPSPRVGAPAPEGGEEAVHRAVEQDVGRAGGGQAQVDLHRVALVGPDATAVLAQGEALLVAPEDEVAQLGLGDRPSGGGHAGPQEVDV